MKYRDLITGEIVEFDDDLEIDELGYEPVDDEDDAEGD